MPRIAKPTDFLVEVPKVGRFTFGRRTMADEVAYQVEFARIIDGVQPTDWLKIIGSALADLRVMTVRAPDGWNLDELDPLDPETEAKLIAVHLAYRDKENSFRRPGRDAATGAGSGSEDVAGGRVPVSAPVQPAAE